MTFLPQHLHKEKDTAMNGHIDQFTKLLQDLEYHKPPDSTPKDKDTVNLTFLGSLGAEWETFWQAKGTTTRTMSTAELFTEVRAIDAGKTPKSVPVTIPPSDQAKVLSTNFNGNQCGGYR